MRLVREDLAPIFTDGAVHEIMAITPKGHVLDLRTDQLNKALDFVQRQDATGATGIYVGNNPLNVRVGGPDKNRPKSQNVAARVSLFLDFDRTEASKHLATHDKLATIHKARQHAQDFLTHLGFPAEASRSGISGNGEYLVYRLASLPVDAETNALVKKATCALRTTIETEYPTVKLDTVTDAVRVRRISGTINRKHDAHRMCLLDVRDQEPVTREILEALAALAPIETERPARPAPEWSGIGMTNEHILEIAFRAGNGEKIRRLYEGDTSGYPASQTDPGYSNQADLALVSLLCGYTPDDDQLADLWRSSGLYRKKLDRNDYVARTIERARSTQTWWHDPNYRSVRNEISTVVVEAPTNAAAEDYDTIDRDQIKALLVELTTNLEQERAARIAAEERVKQCTKERSHLFGILRNSDLGAARLTGFAIALDLSARIANGEQPTDRGLKTPAKRYAEMTGLSENVVAGHMRLLSGDPDSDDPKRKGLGLLTKHVVREQTERETEDEVIDSDTGEIQTKRETIRGVRDANYIEVPEGKVINLIDRLATYQRPDDAGKHGGKRDPRPKCEHHPDAGTIVVRSERVECACCRMILEEKEPTRTYHPSETDEESEEQGSGINMVSEHCVVNPLLSDTKMMPEPESRGVSSGTDIMMPPEHRATTQPRWEDERRALYGQLYRGEPVA